MYQNSLLMSGFQGRSPYKPPPAVDRSTGRRAAEHAHMNPWRDPPPFPAKPAFEGLRFWGRQTPQRPPITPSFAPLQGGAIRGVDPSSGTLPERATLRSKV